MVSPRVSTDSWLWSPWDEIRRLQREMNRLFSDFFGEPVEEVYPAVNVWRKDDSVVVTAEMPGVEPGDIDLSVEGDTLTIRGSRKPEELKEGEEYHRQERHSGAFVRAIELPFRVDPEKVDARYEKGILRVTLPRAEEDKPKQITVKAS